MNDGYINEKHNVFGTYCHGVFDNDELRRAIINALRKRKGLSELPIQFRYKSIKNLSMTVWRTQSGSILIWILFMKS